MPKPQIKKRKTKKSVIVAMVGLVGSGKSKVATEIAEFIGGTIVNSDIIRTDLRKQRKNFKRVQLIAENMAIEIVKSGGNAILDSDYIDAKKRASIREKAKKIGADFMFIRTYADPDIIFGRITTNKLDKFFLGCKTSWDGNKKSIASVVKIRELWRRTPLHYHWEKIHGGRWILKKLPFSSIEIDTSKSYKKLLQKALKSL